jgi:phospholipid/cholesterol/gamma-HCH transport system substrate-binding protein
MAKKETTSNIKLGAFVLAGFFFLILLLFMLGKNQNLFGNTYSLKASFDNVQGLLAGNNVRYSGIQVGTVKKIRIVNDTLIEVTMNIEKRMLPIIRKNAIVSIGTEGFVGNKVVNITPSRKPGPLAKEGDILLAGKALDTDKMLQTLSKTNDDIAVISEGLKTIIERINRSSALWTILDDPSLPKNVRASIENIRQATVKAGRIVDDLGSVAEDIKKGNGSVGSVLKDTMYAQNLNDAILKIKLAGSKVDSLAIEINEVVMDIKYDIENGKGPYKAILNDTAIVNKIHASLDNIQKGTDGFNQNMEALKHNFLLRGYFKKLERKKGKEYQR